MLEIVLAMTLQAPAPVPQRVTLPVSLDRIRARLEQPGRFEPPKPRPWRGLVFRAKVEERFLYEWSPLPEMPPVRLGYQPSTTSAHFQFLQSVTPAEVSGAGVGVGVDILPALGAARRYISKRIYAAKERRAKKEVADAMRAAGIR